MEFVPVAMRNQSLKTIISGVEQQSGGGVMVGRCNNHITDCHPTRPLVCLSSDGWDPEALRLSRPPAAAAATAAPVPLSCSLARPCSLRLF